MLLNGCRSDISESRVSSRDTGASLLFPKERRGVQVFVMHNLYQVLSVCSCNALQYTTVKLLPSSCLLLLFSPIKRFGIFAVIRSINFHIELIGSLFLALISVCISVHITLYLKYLHMNTIKQHIEGIYIEFRGSLSSQEY
jgi:hypothetical protein